MKSIKENIAYNITELRKHNKLTQAELAVKLNYTDKAISKWERGESTPDVDILYKMSELFNVNVDFFFHEDSMTNLSNYSIPKSIKSKRFAQLALMITTVYFIASVIFVYSHIKENPEPYGMWISFVWGAPISCLIALLFMKKYNLKKGVAIISSFGLWSLLTSIYLQMLILDENIWLIFLIGIPLQIAIIISNWLKN